MATGYPELDAAISSAEQSHGLPSGVLEGIWRIESGSTFPNPYVNSEGYGGLFGTGQGSYLWPTQTQANYAASILARLIRSEGSLSAALLAYSGGAYSSVGGAGSGSGTTTTPPPAGGGTDGGVTRPDVPGSNQDASITGALGGALHDVTGFFGGAGHWLGKQASNIWESVDHLAEAVWRGISFFINPLNWLRLAEFLTGMALIGFGIALFVKGSRKEAAQTVIDTTGAVSGAVGQTAALPVKGAHKLRRLPKVPVE